MTETLLDERAVSEIEAEIWQWRDFPKLQETVSALCSTVKHLRAENDEYERRWRNQTQRNHSLSQANRDLQSQLEQLRAENEQLKRTLL